MSPQNHRQWGIFENLERRSDNLTVPTEREIQKGETRGRKTLCGLRARQGSQTREGRGVGRQMDWADMHGPYLSHSQSQPWYLEQS